MSDEVTYWHGGAPGIAAGDRLLTPVALMLSGHVYAPRDAPGLPPTTSLERVYFTTDRQFARAHAHRYELITAAGKRVGRGSLYRVRPIGRVEEDPDYEGSGVSWCAPSGIVLEVEEPKVSMRAVDAERAIGQYCTWDDGRPMYLDDGRLAVTWQLEARGVTQERLDRFIPRWTHWQKALERINELAALGHL